MDVPPITVVVVHRDATRSLSATVGQFIDDPRIAQIVVVDNGSSSVHAAELARLADGWGGRVDVLRLGANTGFGPGANAGLRSWLAAGNDPDAGPAGRTDWAVLVPHDVELAADCLDRLFAAVEPDPMIGLVCADVGDGQTPMIDPYFGGMTRPASVECGWEDADYPHGTLMVLRRSCVEDIGLFDERYFAYCEEAELALRAHRSGWRVGLVRGALVRNLHVGSSVALVDYLQNRNTLLLVREMSGRYHAFIRLCIAVAQLISGTARPARRPLVFDGPARRRALLDHLRRRYGPPPPGLIP